MVALLVVLDHPPPRRLPDILKADEQVQVEHFLAEGAVESFDVGILIWLIRLDVVDRYTVLLEPLDE